MGKIHDALEKNQQNNAPFIITKERSRPQNADRPHVIKTVDRTREKSAQNNDIPLETSMDANLIAWFNPGSIEAEQFRILKTNLMFPENGKPPRTIMVTSTEPNEGKSLVAANLAISIAQSVDQHVLLMDCDIRKPTIHAMMGFKEVPGLREYLEHKVSVSAIIHKTQVQKLSILPGGTPHPTPSDLLSSQKMAGLIREVRNRYDDRLIIVDTPPPRLTAEAGALSKHVDGIILVIRHGKAPKKAIKNLVDILGRDKILGVVPNGFNWDVSLKYGKRSYNSFY